MSDITREEHDAKLEAVEARLETKLVTMDAKLDRIGGQISAAVERLSSETMGAKEAAQRAELRADEARSAASSMKWNILFTALGAVAVLVAFWAIWQGM